MAARAKSVYRCTECGAEHPKWAGRCEACGEWNTLAEEAAPRPAKPAARSRVAPGTHPAAAGAASPVKLRDVQSARASRLSSGIAELDFVLGGGIVPGSMVLVGGEPGIGKSTLLLQVAGSLTAGGTNVLYVSGRSRRSRSSCAPSGSDRRKRCNSCAKRRWSRSWRSPLRCGRR